MNPVGKYFKTSNEKIYCYARDEIFKHTYTCLCVGDNYIKTMFWSNIGSFPKSTKKAFLKAYAKTIETIDGIVEAK